MTEAIQKSALTKLSKLVTRIDDIIETEVSEGFSEEEVAYILANFSEHLKLTLKTPFEDRRERDRKNSPLNELFNT
jgi:hypothetical protein